jgi:predicted MFS family arabinose efflux permease
MHYRVAQVFIPFAFAYLLSYVVRSVNAVLSGPFTEELGLSASELGLLSSAYFLTFAAMQIPLGALLDRKGPKNVEAVLLLFAVAGCLISSVSTSFLALWVGRAFIGIGVSACLMASYKAYRICFRDDLQPALASLMLMVGSFGALIATLPVELALPAIGWRGVFVAMAVFFLLSTLGLVVLLPKLPEPAPNNKPYWQDTFSGVKEIYRHPEIRRVLPFSIFVHGGFMAVQGLWMGPWFRVVDGQSSTQAAVSLLVLGVVTTIAHLSMSWMLSTKIKKWGWSLDSILIGGTTVLLLASTAAVFNVWGNSLFGWSLMVFATGFSAVNYAKATLAFPAQMAGRATTGLNFIVFIGAFSVQWGLGLFADLFASVGFDAADSLRASFSVWLAMQLFALVWLIRKPKSADGHP